MSTAPWPLPRSTPIDLAVAKLTCLQCTRSDFIAETGAVRCKCCGNGYPIVAGIVNALASPSQDVLDELRGMMKEAHFAGDVSAFVIRRVERVSSFEDRKRSTADDVFDYYGSTELNFLQALEHVHITGREDVLEIGGSDDYPFLKPFRDRGCNCFETNIYFLYDDEAARSGWPVRVLGDMNALPFRDSTFDIVIISAASHHSSDLRGLASELARVTRRGGTVININEPIRGMIKHAFTRARVARGDQDQQHRDELVHEHEYSIFEYMRAFRRAGLKLQTSLFSDYYSRRLNSGRTGGVRFSWLAAGMSRAWRNRQLRQLAIGPGLWLGQATIGLQMNVVLRRVA